MPMIDVYSTPDTFADKHTLAHDLANAVMRWEQVPPIALFSKNTAAFIHELPADSLSNAAGDSNYVRIQVLTPVGVLDREKQLGVVKELTEIVAAAALRSLILRAISKTSLRLAANVAITNAGSHLRVLGVVRATTSCSSTPW